MYSIHSIFMMLSSSLTLCLFSFLSLSSSASLGLSVSLHMVLSISVPFLFVSLYLYFYFPLSKFCNVSLSICLSATLFLCALFVSLRFLPSCLNLPFSLHLSPFILLTSSNYFYLHTCLILSLHLGSSPQSVSLSF